MSRQNLPWPTLRWHYGPTEDDPDRGKMWHYDCGGEVLYIEGGLICMRCNEQEDDEAAVPGPEPSEPQK